MTAAWRQAREEIEQYQLTLAQPRFRLANRLNRIIRAVPPLHRVLKKAVSSLPD
jgi:hypothetical protein